MSGEQGDARFSKVRTQRQCKKIMDRYPGIVARPVWREEQDEDGERRGSWYISVSQTRQHT